MSDGEFQREDFIPTDVDRENFKMMEEEEKYEYDILGLVKGSNVKFDHYRQGYFYYNIIRPTIDVNNDIFQFPVPLDDIGTATLLNEDKALTYMRWIRKAIQDKTLIKIH